jgi:hypothetical protein
MQGAEWFYLSMDQQFGPVEWAELRRLVEGGTVTRDTLVRRGTDGDWMLAEDVRGLVPLPPPSPPPLPHGRPPTLPPSSPPALASASDRPATYALYQRRNLGSISRVYDRIGGWLILPAIGLVISPIGLAIGVATYLWPAFESEFWSRLTTPGSPHYHPLIAPLFVFELAGNILFFIWVLALALLFFQRWAATPTVFIAYLVARLVFVVADAVFAYQIPLMAQQAQGALVGGLAVWIVACVIWVPYFLLSKRVKGTFLR